MWFPQATDFMTSHLGDPFLLYVAFSHVHAPNFASDRFCNASARGPVGDAVQELDDGVGQLLAFLDAHNLAEDTVVFFSSDNGAPLTNDCLGNGALRDGKFTTWEGGVRVGGLVRWAQSTRAPGTASDALVMTADIFPTILGIAGVPLPPNRVIDGISLAPLLSTSKGGGGQDVVHDCLFHYHAACFGTSGGSKCKGKHPGAVVNSSDGTSIITGIAAVRCGAFKAHFVTTDSAGAKACGTAGVYPPTTHDPPLMFNLATDPGESAPVVPTSATYSAALARINAALVVHAATLTPVPDQMVNNMNTMSHTYAVCADPQSKETFPQWPNCTLTPSNFYKPRCAHSCNAGGANVHGESPVATPWRLHGRLLRTACTNVGSVSSQPRLQIVVDMQLPKP